MCVNRGKVCQSVRLSFLLVCARRAFLTISMISRRVTGRVVMHCIHIPKLIDGIYRVFLFYFIIMTLFLKNHSEFFSFFFFMSIF